MVRVKICGLTREQDVDLALELGAHAVGFVMQPNSARNLPLERVRALAARAKPYATAVAVVGPYRELDLLDVVQGVQATDFTTATPPPGLLRVFAHRVRKGEPVVPPKERCDAVLLDAYREGVYGGTGETIDWDFAADYVASCALPVILAGGINADNVAEAVAKVQPYAVDLASGVESEPGIKDPAKMKAFFQAVRSR